VPRRPQRRPVARKGAPKVQTEDTGACDASARRGLAAHGGDPARIETLVPGLQQFRDDTDRVALHEPSPDAPHEYRRTNAKLAEAQRVLAMVTGR
jgi:hypothetical protein